MLQWCGVSCRPVSVWLWLETNTAVMKLSVVILPNKLTDCIIFFLFTYSFDDFICINGDSTVIRDLSIHESENLQRIYGFLHRRT